MLLQQLWNRSIFCRPTGSVDQRLCAQLPQLVVSKNFGRGRHFSGNKFLQEQIFVSFCLISKIFASQKFPQYGIQGLCFFCSELPYCVATNTVNSLCVRVCIPRKSDVQINREFVDSVQQLCTVGWEIFTLKIICTKNFRIVKFSWFRSIHEIFCNGWQFAIWMSAWRLGGI